MSEAIVAFGANLGDPKKMFGQVLEAIQDIPHVESVRSSSLYLTAPVGDSGDAYFNGAFAVQTAASYRELFDHLRSIEQQFGRDRKGDWSPRTVDLDLVLFGNEIVDEADLKIPHPRMHYRRFVLDPVVEIAGDTVHAVLKLSCSDLKLRCESQLERPQMILPPGAKMDEVLSAGESKECIRLSTSEMNSIAALWHGGAVVGVSLPKSSTVWDRCDVGRCWFAWVDGEQIKKSEPSGIIVPAVDLSGDAKEEWKNFLASLAAPRRIT